jgi:hypothetical protein
MSTVCNKDWYPSFMFIFSHFFIFLKFFISVTISFVVNTWLQSFESWLKLLCNHLILANRQLLRLYYCDPKTSSTKSLIWDSVHKLADIPAKITLLKPCFLSCKAKSFDSGNIFYED